MSAIFAGYCLKKFPEFGQIGFSKSSIYNITEMVEMYEHEPIFRGATVHGVRAILGQIKFHSRCFGLKKAF